MSDGGLITVVLADDHGLVRKGLRLLLDTEDDLQVVAEAATTEDAVRLARAHHARILVLDLDMSGGSSLEAIPEVLAGTTEIAVVVFTPQDDPVTARQALEAGAKGFVLEESADDELLEAVRRAAAGDTYVNPRVEARLAAEPEEPPDDLSQRELDVLRLIALGHTNAEIGKRLYLSTRTVETHRAHIQQKLRTTTRADLVRYALEHGLLDHRAEL